MADEVCAKEIVCVSYAHGLGLFLALNGVGVDVACSTHSSGAL